MPRRKVTQLSLLSHGFLFTVLMTPFPTRRYIDGIDVDISQRLADLERRVNCELEDLCCIEARLATDGCCGWIASADYLHWTVRQAGAQYGITDIGGVQYRGAVGNVLAIGGNYEPGYRFTLGKRFANGVDITGKFTDFDSSATETRAGSIRSVFVSSDNSENNDSDGAINDITPDDRATGVTATMDFDINTYDLEIGQNLIASDAMTLRVHAAGRFADINQRFGVTYTGGDFQAPFSPFQETDYQGGGLLFGAESRWYVTERFTLNVGLSGGMMIGSVDTRTFIPDDEPGVPTDVSYSETRVTPIIEANVGVNYQRDWGRWKVNMAAGYELSSWFNLADSRVFTDSHMEGKTPT
jgi:hypothetical protein